MQQEENETLKRIIKHQASAAIAAQARVTHLQYQNSQLKARAIASANAREALRSRGARMLSTDHIVLGGKRMRLVVMQQHADTPAGTKEFSTVPVDAEGNDVIEEADIRPRKRQKVRCFDWLVKLEKGPAVARAGVGGWQYDTLAKINQFLHEASGGHAACTNESKRLTQDAERRTHAAAITVEDGKHLPRIDTNTPLHLRPSYGTMVKRVNPALNHLQTLCVAWRALTPSTFTLDPDGRLVRLLTNNVSFDGTQLLHHHMLAGVLITILQYIEGTDAFETPIMGVEAHRANMNPVLAANKIASRVRNSKTRKEYLPETARALALAAEISGLTPAFGDGNMYFSFDGAVENSGGNRDNMFGELSVLNHLFGTREVWEQTRKMLDDCGVGGHLRQFLAQKDLPGLNSQVQRTLRQEHTARVQARQEKRDAKMMGKASAARAEDLNAGVTGLNTDSVRPDSGSLDSSENMSDPGQGQPLPRSSTPLPIPSHSSEGGGDSREDSEKAGNGDEPEMAGHDSEGESEKAEDSELSSESSEESDDSDDGPVNEDCGNAEAPETVKEAFLRDCPKARASARKLRDTNTQVPASPECHCRRERRCRDNSECNARYMLGTVFVGSYARGAKNVRTERDIASHPEYYRHHDCYDVRFAPDHDDPAQILERATMVSIVVKSRCKEVVLNLSRMRHAWLVWSVLRGEQLRALGLWRQKAGSAELELASEAQPVSQAALDAHAAALNECCPLPTAAPAAAVLDANRRALIPTPEDFEDSLSVLKAALDQSRLQKPTSDSPDAEKDVYKKRHALRFEARLFLVRLGSILYCDENRRRRLPSFIGNKRFCMPVNPLSFLPCVDNKAGPEDESDGYFCQVNGAVHCSMHRIHLGSHGMSGVINGGLEQTVVHAAKWGMVSYHRGHLSTALDLLLCDPGSVEAKERDAGTDYYAVVTEATDEQHTKGKGHSLTDIRELMRYDSEKGFCGVKTCNTLRWGSVLHACGEHLPLSMPLALAIIRRFALGTDDAKVAACLAIVSYRGFIPSEHPRIKIEEHAQRVFALYTRTQDHLQLAALRLVYKLTVRLFLKHASSDHECGTHAMMGLNSVVRNVLLVLSVDIWVAVRGARHGRPTGRWAAKGLGWGRKLTNPFRSDGAELESGSSVLLLDPACGPKVAARLGSACDEEAEHAVSELVATLRLLAMREGEVMPEDMLQAYRKAYPKLSQQRLSNHTHAVKMSEMQFFIKHVLLDVIASVRGQMQRELRGLPGVLAGITETERSSTFEYENDAEGTPGPKFIVSASAMALAHAAAFAIGARDLVKWMEPQMDASKEDRPEHFLPSWGMAFSEKGLAQLDDFLGISRKNAQDQQRLRIDPFGRHDVGKLPQIKGCAQGKNIVDGKELYNRPSQCFPELNHGACIAQYTVGNSKPVEGSMSTPCALLKTKPRMTFPQIVHLMRRRFFLEPQNQRFLQRVRANNGIMYTGAEGVGRLDGWKNDIFANNRILGDAMFDSYTMQDPKRMPAGIRKGGAWKKTYLCEESRTKKFSQPTKDSVEERRLNGMILKICTRADPEHGVVADTQLQSRARAVRAKRGNGSKPAAATAALHRSLSRSGRVSAGGGPGRGGGGVQTRQERTCDQQGTWPEPWQGGRREARPRPGRPMYPGRRS